MQAKIIYSLRFLLIIIGFFYYSLVNGAPIANYTPIANEFQYTDPIQTPAQVFTPTQSASSYDIMLELATCKQNGLAGAQLDIVTVTAGEPDWTNVLGSAIIPDSDIYGWPGCVTGSFGPSIFSFSGLPLVSGTQYALVLRLAPGAAPSASIAWRRSSTPTDPSNPYTSGDLWTLASGTSNQSSNLDLQFDIYDCQNVANYTPIANEFQYTDPIQTPAQVFTPTQSASSYDIMLELATCKQNGLAGAQLDIVTVTAGEPDWTNVLGSAIIPDSDIYGWPGCVTGSFGPSIFSFSGLPLVSGTQYALVLRLAPGAAPSASIAWRRSSTPTDPSNPYTSGDLWTLASGTSNQSLNLDLQFDICAPFQTLATWTGFSSTAWGVASNWSSGSVPSFSDEIVIPDVSGASGNFPVTSTDIAVIDLTVEASASLTIGVGTGLIIGVNGTVTNNGLVTLDADASGTAWLDDFTNFGASFIGNLTAEQYVNIGSAVGQRMFGSPVNNGVVSGLNQTYASGSTGQIVMSNCVSAQVDQGSPYNNLFEWNESASLPNSCEYEAWFARTQSTPLENGRGYSGWMNAGSVISFTGNPNTGNVTYGGSLVNSNTGLSNKDGWHVLSNPYPSSIDISGLATEGWQSPQTYVASQAYGGTFQPVLPGQNLAVAQGFVASIPTVSGALLGSDNAFTSTAPTSGSVISGFNFGLAFDVVNAPVLIERLGAYDTNGDGLIGTSTVTIYNRNSQAIVVQTTLTGSSYPLEDGFRWRTLNTPISLPPGQYIVSRYGDELNDFGTSSAVNNSISNIDFTAGGSSALSSFASGTSFPSSPWQATHAVSSASFSVQGGPIIPNEANFTNAMRTQGSTDFKSNNNWYDAKLDIEVSNGTSQDITYIYFNNDATQTFDSQWDCEKRDSDAGIPTLFTSTTGKQTSLNGNNMTELGNYSFPMGLKPGSDNSFTFTVDGISTFPATTMIYLEDKATGTWTNLRDNNTYTFNMTTQEAEDRFEVHFSKPIGVSFEAESCDGNDGSISVEFGNQSINGNLQSWNYEIQKDLSVIASGSEAGMMELVDLEPGVYEITFTNGNLQVTESFTIEDKVEVVALFDAPLTEVYVGDEITLANATVGASIYTWEVNGETLNTQDLTYTFLTAGNYLVSLFVENADCNALTEQTIEVLNKTTGIAEQVALDNILVYTKDNSIVIDISQADLEGQTDLEVYNTLGQLILQKLDIQTIEKIEMANQARGYYFVNIINQQEQISKKVIIK